jgi:hypothetical protein
MRNHASTVSPIAPNPRTRARCLPGCHSGGGLRRIRRVWHSPPPLPSIEEAERRMRNRPGFIASLTPGQIAMIRAHDGPELWGNPNGPERQ